MNKIGTFRRVSIFLFAGFLSVGLLFGCAPRERSLFEPKVMPPEEVESAIVRTATPILRGGTDSIRIVTVDGRLPTFLNNTCILSPGYHVLEIQVEIKKPDPKNRDNSIITKILQKLNVGVRAQHEYLVDATENGTTAWIWVQDVNTGEVVGGQPPA